MNKSLTNAKKGMRKKATKKSIDDYLYHIVIGGFLLSVALTLIQEHYRDRRALHDIPVIENTIITRHNTLADSSYEINENDFFVDWTLKDAKAILSTQLNHQTPNKCTVDLKSEIMDSYDFRDEHSGCIAKKRMNSQNCSLSHVLAVVSAVEDRHCKTNGQRIAVSAQQILDCGQQTCQGGDSYNVIQYMTANKSVMEECLPYDSQKKACNLTSCQQTQIVNGACIIGREDMVKREIQLNGPVVASIVIYRDFLLYQSGIYKPMEDIAKFQGRHQVKVIGWGKDEKKREYWLIENSWGSTWGEEGYARIYMGFKDIQIDTNVLAPIVNKIAEDQ